MVNPTMIKHPRRILLLGRHKKTTEHVAKILVGPSDTKSPADSGTKTHLIETPYYSASIPVWLDEVSSPSTWSSQWQAEEGAGDVVRAIGAWIICFTKPKNEAEKSALKDLLTSVSSVISHHLNYSSSKYVLDVLDESDIVNLAVAVPSTPGTSQPPITADLDADLEDLCQSAGSGWEYVDGTVGAGSGRRNEFGEAVGVDRLLEALKGGEWDAGGIDDDDDAGIDLDELEENTGTTAADDYDVREDEFGDFASATSPTRGGSAVDPFTGGEMADFFGELLAAGRSSRNAAATTTAAAAVGGTAITDEEREEARKTMSEGLLANAQSQGQSAEGADEFGNPDAVGADDSDDAAAHGQIRSSVSFDEESEDKDDPWRVRGKGRGAPGMREQFGMGFPGQEGGDDGGDDDVERLQSMMLRLQAARDLGADLPAAQRRQLAAKAVREVMRDV